MSKPVVNIADLTLDRWSKSDFYGAADARIGPMKTLGLPIKSSCELSAIRAPAPWLGQHSEEVLRGLGCSAEEIAGLFEAGIVFDQYRGTRA